MVHMTYRVLSNDTFIFIKLGNDPTHDIEKIFEIEKLPAIPGKKVKTLPISSTSPVKSIQCLLKKFNITPLIDDENSQHIQNSLMKSFTRAIF